MQAGMPSSPALSVSSQATSSSASTCSSSKGFLRSFLLKIFFNVFFKSVFVFFTLRKINWCISLFLKKNTKKLFTPLATLFLVQEGTLKHLQELLQLLSSKSYILNKFFNAGKALQQSADSGNEPAKSLLSEHWKAQEVSHYRSKEDAQLFFTKTFNQSPDHEQLFMQNALFLERARISHDQISRLLLGLGQIKASSTAMSQNLTVSESTSTHVSLGAAKRFASTKLHEDCKQAIRNMVLRNPIEFMFMKSVKKYISHFVEHPLCPMEGMRIDERVSLTRVQFVDFCATLPCF